MISRIEAYRYLGFQKLKGMSFQNYQGQSLWRDWQRLQVWYPVQY